MCCYHILRPVSYALTLIDECRPGVVGTCRATPSVIRHSRRRAPVAVTCRTVAIHQKLNQYLFQLQYVL